MQVLGHLKLHRQFLEKVIFLIFHMFGPLIEFCKKMGKGGKNPLTRTIWLFLRRHDELTRHNRDAFGEKFNKEKSSGGMTKAPFFQIP